MFLVIDGSSMLVTNYYGNLPKQIMFEKDEEKKKENYKYIMQTSNGVYTNAVYGMMRTLLKIFKNQKPDFLVVTFDKTRNTFRREMYADYKRNRSETPEPLKEQFKLMESILEEIGVVTLYSDTYEADDLAGSVIRRFEGPEMPIRFITKDHDYLQLVSEYTRGWMVQTKQERAEELYEKYYVPFGLDLKEIKKALPDKVFEFTPDYVLAEEGVRPDQITDLKSIVGDSSDNIPGVKGVSSAAVPLLKEYGTIESIYAQIDSIGDDKKAEKELVQFWKESLGIKRSPLKALKENKELAFLSKDLATIRTDVDVPGNLEDYRFKILEDKLHDVLVRLEFKSLLNE